MTDHKKIINTAESTMDDIVFVERNKSYGAFQLRKAFSKNFGLAMLISAVILTTLISIYSFVLKNKDKEVEKEVMVEMIIEDVALEKDAPEPEKIEVPPPKVDQIKFVPFEIKDILKAEQTPDIDSLEKAKNIGNKNEKGDSTRKDLEDPLPPGKALGEEEDEGFMNSFSEDAKFPGGMGAFKKFLQNNVSYPSRALKQEKEGSVSIYFEVDKTGQIINIRVFKGFDTDCDEEALRVVKLMAEKIKWEPANQNGRPGKVKKIIPVKFVLPKEEE